MRAETANKMVDREITSKRSCTVFLVGYRVQDPSAGHGGSWQSWHKHWPEQEGNWALWGQDNTWCSLTQTELQSKHKVQGHFNESSALVSEILNKLKLICKYVMNFSEWTWFTHLNQAVTLDKEQEANSSSFYIQKAPGSVSASLSGDCIVTV